MTTPKTTPNAPREAGETDLSDLEIIGALANFLLVETGSIYSEFKGTIAADYQRMLPLSS